MSRKKLLFSLLLGPFPLIFLAVLLSLFYPHFTSNSIKFAADIDKVQLKIRSFEKYNMNSDDFNFLQRFPEILQAGNKLFAAHLNVIHKLIIFISIISIIQTIVIIHVFRKERVV